MGADLFAFGKGEQRQGEGFVLCQCLADDLTRGSLDFTGQIQYGFRGKVFDKGHAGT